jgi:hypothetical protein
MTGTKTISARTLNLDDIQGNVMRAYVFHPG